MSEQPRKWRESGSDRDRIEVDILLPYGVLIPLQCKKTQKLVDIKTMVWREAQKYPLAKLLWNDPSRYQFMCVNQRAEKIELYDETKSLADIKPYKPILQLFERVGDREEKEFNAKMSVLIGKGVYEMEQSNEEEVCTETLLNLLKYLMIANLLNMNTVEPLRPNTEFEFQFTI